MEEEREGEGEYTCGRCSTKESGRNNVREINARDVVAGYREQRRQANRHADTDSIEIAREREEKINQGLLQKRGRTTEDEIKQEIPGRYNSRHTRNKVTGRNRGAQQQTVV